MHLGEVSFNIKLSDGRSPGCSVEEFQRLIAAARRFKGQPPLEGDGKFRVSFNSVHFVPNAVNMGFLDHVPLDVDVPPLEFTRYGLPLPPDSVDEFHCYGFVHRIRSDCELTHFFENVFNILKPGGICHFRAISLLTLMERCIEAQSCDNDLHIVERQLFGGQDRSGLYFNQASLNKSRIISRMRHAGFLKIDIQEDDADSAHIPKEADQVWLREFTPEQMEICLSSKRCIMEASGCKSPRAIKPYRPSEFSIYCKRHYQKANHAYVTMLQKRMSIRFFSVKPEMASAATPPCDPDGCIPSSLEADDGKS